MMRHFVTGASYLIFSISRHGGMLILALQRYIFLPFLFFFISTMSPWKKIVFSHRKNVQVISQKERSDIYSKCCASKPATHLWEVLPGIYSFMQQRNLILMKFSHFNFKKTA